jgi:hypothetical protein
MRSVGNSQNIEPRDERDLCAALVRELDSFTPAWNLRRLQYRLVDIVRFWRFNGAEVIPKSDRDQIARLANELHEKLSGLGGLDEVFLDTLRDLAAGSSKRTGRGGDRRSGERTLRSSVLGMAIRLYLEAAERPTISKSGKLFRFANLVGELVMRERDPFTGDAVEKEARRMKRILPPRRPSLSSVLYRSST